MSKKRLRVNKVSVRRISGSTLDEARGGYAATVYRCFAVGGTNDATIGTTGEAPYTYKYEGTRLVPISG